MEVRRIPLVPGVYDFIRERWGETVWILAHSRSGKSTTGLVVTLEECIRSPHTQVAVVCKSNIQARDICNLSFAALLEDCPDSVRPKDVKDGVKDGLFRDGIGGACKCL